MNSKFLSIIGALVGILGLIGLLMVIFDISLPVSSQITGAYGPCAAIVFGWLLIVPNAYEDIPRKGYLIQRCANALLV
jgi:hypothetical protein